MRLEVRIIAEESRLQKDYRKLFLGLIKRELNESDVNYIFPKNNEKQPPFTFALLLPKGTKFEKEFIMLGEKQIKLTFSTSDEKVYKAIFDVFMKLKGQRRQFRQILEQTMYFSGVSPIQTPAMGDSELKEYQIISPILIREMLPHFKEVYYEMKKQGDKWEDVLLDNVIDQLGDAAEGLVDSETSIIPLRVNKTVVMAYKHQMTANLGTIQIDALPELHEYLYHNGIGCKTQQGFGMLRYIKDIEE